MGTIRNDLVNKSKYVKLLQDNEIYYMPVIESMRWSVFVKKYLETVLIFRKKLQPICNMNKFEMSGNVQREMCIFLVYLRSIKSIWLGESNPIYLTKICRNQLYLRVWIWPDVPWGMNPHEYAWLSVSDLEPLTVSTTGSVSVWLWPHVCGLGEADRINLTRRSVWGELPRTIWPWICMYLPGAMSGSWFYVGISA